MSLLQSICTSLTTKNAVIDRLSIVNSQLSTVNYQLFKLCLKLALQ
ncbi:MAG: hypothetical protein ACRC62_16275 [Microcoleus sp.]